MYLKRWRCVSHFLIKRTVRSVDVVLETHERYRRNVQREKEREIDTLALIAEASCMRIDRSRELKSGKAWIRDRCPELACPGVEAATDFLSRQPFYMPLYDLIFSTVICS